MLKEMLIKGGLTVAALVVAETIIGKLEKRALRHDVEEVESDKEEWTDERREKIMKRAKEAVAKYEREQAEKAEKAE